jgi:YggT family protein
MYGIVTVVRYAVFAALCLAALAATGRWLVYSQKVSPFSALGRFLKKTSDPVLVPVEKRVVRYGGLPSHAGWWLIVGTAVIGVLLIWVTRGVIGTLYELRDAMASGGFGLIRYLLSAACDLLMIALIVRVVGSWIGAFRYSRWMRPAYFLTDWLVGPIAKVMPTYGGLDWSPFVAFLILWIVKAIV